jgi:hypothetical protein
MPGAARPRSHWAALGAASLGLACGELDDPSLRPVDEARFAAPPPALVELQRDPHRNVFWGDLHIHTSYSYDAYTMGVRAMPDDAYLYAKGGTIQHAGGYPIRATRPLDFAAVTDHAEYLGVPRHRAATGEDDDVSFQEILESRSRLRITWHFLSQTLGRMHSRETRDETFGGTDPGVSAAAWRDIVETAGRHDEPGRFTAFIGYEWSSMPNEENLHRNVIYRSGLAPDRPFSSLDSDDPEDLWRALEAQRGQGMEAIAIPHNANVSNGKMYDRVTLAGAPLDATYAEARMRNEPISEILQVKGSSETHPILSSDDEFARFELFDRVMSLDGPLSEPRGSYARDALRAGLEMSAREGSNPYRFGVIGSSDSHNASSSVEEANYHGKLPLIDGSVGLRTGESTLLPADQNRGAVWSAAGLAAIWADENTRASLFDAMRRKETYATSGPRIQVRFFGGFGWEDSLLDDPDAIARAYATGVPMGGDLVSGGRAPRFYAVALKDPLGAHLDRIQIVKGWTDAMGTSHERIYDIAASDGRAPDPETHRVGPVGSTVDVARATWEDSIGAPELRAVWSDPDFDSAQEAFYYARVIQIPTPRWSTYDAVAMGTAPTEPATIQERAITSAIWVRPDADRLQ